MADVDGKPSVAASGKVVNPQILKASDTSSTDAELTTHFDYTEDDEKKLVRKIDWRIIPFLWGYAVLSAVDKVIISNAALYGMKTSTSLTGQSYSWVGSIFYFGYLVAEFPAVHLMSRFPLGKILSFAGLGWSAMTLRMAATHNAAGLLALRLFMGMMEAPALPCLTLVTVMWYRKREQGVRVAVWSATVASVYVGLISYGIGHSTVAIASWRLLFLVLGGVSFVFCLALLI